MTSALSAGEPSSRSVDSAAFRQVFRQQAATVAVVMTGGASPAGFTVTSLTPLAADPPLVSFNIDRASSSWPAVSQAEHLAVHLLATGQQEVARVFATSGIDRFAAVTSWRRGPYGLPVLDEALANLVIRTRGLVDAGDHAVVVADVVGAQHRHAAPLLYHQGRYTSVTEAKE